MGENTQESSVTQKLVPVKSLRKDASNGKSSSLPSLNRSVDSTRVLQKQSVRLPPLSKRPESKSVLLEPCRHFCLTTFFRKHDPVRSLGITSSIAGEGKTLLSIGTALALAHDSTVPVILLECNWSHKSLQQYFKLPKGPGLAEWLRGECQVEAIRHRVAHNLTVIPAGECRQDAVQLLQHLQQQGLQKSLGLTDDLLIVDLPPIVSTAYGSLAASLVEALAVVVRAGVTPASVVQETCTQLKDMQIEGLILNQVQSKIPRWLRRIL